MSFWKDWERYNNYKIIRAIDKAIDAHFQDRSRLKLAKKQEKKRLIDNYGNRFYLQEQLWKRIKDQLKSETYEQWKIRVRNFGFTLDGVEIATVEQHWAIAKDIKGLKIKRHNR